MPPDWCARAKAETTSARPPTLAKGAASEATWTMWRGRLLLFPPPLFLGEEFDTRSPAVLKGEGEKDGRARERERDREGTRES